jgi:hypothetical protein
MKQNSRCCQIGLLIVLWGALTLINQIAIKQGKCGNLERGQTDSVISECDPLDSGRMDFGRMVSGRMDLGRMYFGRITFCNNWILAE